MQQTNWEKIVLSSHIHFKENDDGSGRSDMTFAVDWSLKNNYLSIDGGLVVGNASGIKWNLGRSVKYQQQSCRLGTTYNMFGGVQMTSDNSFASFVTLPSSSNRLILMERG